MGRKAVVRPGDGRVTVSDANPASTASDDAQALFNQMKIAEQVAEQKTIVELKKDSIAQAEQDQLDAEALEEAQDDQRFEDLVSDTDYIAQLFVLCKTDTIYENSKSEYFTEHNLAVNSEKGKASRVKTHTKENKQ